MISFGTEGDVDRLRWDRMQALFHEAAECAASERRPFLERRCPGEPELVADVLALLEEDARTSLLDRDVAHVAADLMGWSHPPRAIPGISIRID